ncbi:VCBS repeat-containing protein [uncultured Imperialibacter sp.]|uniref:VCBS repeat-containing protein n=1 Tax=uncultured Imperialibacter sp. TaxID=1672639 RepID=UPI0030DC2B82|tara:strand:+ start:13345 stop:16893 length:3549 start_codon:yes stop_codon:yes gene_type:complete
MFRALVVAGLIAIFLASCGDRQSTLFRELPASDTGIDFSNTIVESDTFNILTNEYIYNGGGVGAGDFNNDGLTDLFFTGNQTSNKLFINKGGLEFNDVSAEAGIEAPDKWSQGIALVDINGDGWLDIYVCATMYSDSLKRENMLFVNQGGSPGGVPTFKEMARQYGVNDNGWSTNAAFLDYDKDGDLDLYVLTNVQSGRIPTNYRPKIVDGTAPNTDRFYKNNGDGTFSIANREAGILYEGFGLGIAIADVNNDSWPDIYVSNDFLSNDLLYINNGDGTFTNKLGEYVRHSSQFSMGNDIADINNDGWVDIVTLDMLPETNFRKKTTIGKNVYQVYINNERFDYEYQHVRNMLQLNNGAGIPFSEIGFMSEIFETDWSWSPLLADVDNDGDRDLLITNGFPKDITDKDFASYRADVGNIAGADMLVDSIPVVKISNFAFENNGDLTFSDATRKWGLYKPSFSNGAAFTDLDNDGDLDYVVNTIDDVALVYENTLNSKANSKQDSIHFLRVKLKGNKENQAGLGTKITLKYGNGQMQYHDHSVYRGFLSSVEDIAHFGMGRTTSIDSVVVDWYDGKSSVLTNVAVDQVLTIDYSSASSGDNLAREMPALGGKPTVLADVTKSLQVAFTHKEEDKIDFNLQRTLPHKFTQYGPAIAVGDINGDGLEDFITGGTANQGIQFFLQKPDGTFQEKIGVEKKGVEQNEYMGLLLFDIDIDGDLDLYAVSGGGEYVFPSDKYADHLYLNDGRGNFKLQVDGVSSDLQFSGSIARAADFDKDGDLDVFVGGRVVPASYPYPSQSVLLENQGGRLVDVTASKAPFLADAGMITDMLWTDYNADGLVDMVLVGEFMPITFVKNEDGAYRVDLSTGLLEKKGWWNSIVSGDFDKDGDTDYVAGNLGENNYYRATMEQPLRAYAKDFDGNASVDLIMSCYFKTDNGEMKEFPLHFWDEMNSQSPMFRKMFSRYKQFGKITMAELFTKQQLEGALILEANYMKSSYIENLGNGTFKMTALPIRAQIAPINGMVATDVNSDGHLDVLMVGNDYGNEVFPGRYDALTGLLLFGDGKGNFSPVLSAKSGFLVEGDAKSLVRLSSVAGNDIFVASQNRGDLKVFGLPNDAFKGTVVKTEPTDFYALLKHSGGQTERVELTYGSGFLSQSSRTIRIPEGVTQVEIFDFSGDSRVISSSNQ